MNIEVQFLRQGRIALTLLLVFSVLTAVAIEVNFNFASAGQSDDTYDLSAGGILFPAIGDTVDHDGKGDPDDLPAQSSCVDPTHGCLVLLVPLKASHVIPLMKSDLAVRLQHFYFSWEPLGLIRPPIQIS